MKVAIVHDWLANLGGAERIVKIFSQIFPNAPIYTLVYDKERMNGVFNGVDIRTSFIQKLPLGVKKYGSLLPLMPLAVESFDLSEYDLIISSSTCCAKGVITRADAIHICYCHTPMRYGWDFYFEYLQQSGLLKRKLIPFFMKGIRQWDVVSANRVDYFIANSNYVRKRISKHYRRDAEVIYPPVEFDFYNQKFTPAQQQNFYLTVSRLVRYKRIDIAVEAFNYLKKPLIIIGDGSEYKNLKKIAGPHIKFLGRLTNQQIRDYYNSCKAFIFCAEEDFGITPLEAQACGKPVLAYGKGGVLETVLDRKTGLFFDRQDADALKDCVERFESMSGSFCDDFIRNHCRKFDQSVFCDKFKSFVLSVTGGL